VRGVGVLRWLGVAVTAVVMAGCGVGSGPAAGVSPSASRPADDAGLRSRWSSCAAEVGDPLNPGPGLGPATALPSGFRAAAVVRCVGGDRTNRDGSQDGVMEERLTSAPAAVARLVVALGLPDSPPS